MKTAFAFLALFASIAIAQDPASLEQAGFPKCAQQCIIKGNKQAGCDPTDSKCGCSDKANQAVAACFQATNPCSPSDGQKSQDVGKRVCAQLGASPSTGNKAQASSSGNSTTPKPSSGATSNMVGGLVGLVGAVAAMAI